MKVLFITHNLKGNDGWSRYSLDLIGVLMKEGAEVLCLVNELSSETNIPQKKCLGASVLYVANPVIAWRTSSFVNKYIREFSPDIVHFIVEPYGNMIPFLKKSKAKVVLTVHSTFAFMPILVSGFRRFVSNIMTKWMYSKVDLVIAVSEYTKQHLLRHMSVINATTSVDKKMAVSSGGIDLSKFVLRHGNNASTTKEILFVGAIKPRKGLKEAIDALAHVKADYIFRIVGMYNDGDPYFQLLKQKIAEYKLGRKVIFVGQVSDDQLKELYSNANLYLMLSTNNGADFEGYGLVYVEANAYGVPCIGPNDSGVSDAIVDGKTGYLVNQFDAPAVAKTIDSVLAGGLISPENCVAWAKENSKEKKASQMMALYDGII